MPTIQEQLREKRRKAAQDRINKGVGKTSDYKMLGMTPPSTATRTGGKVRPTTQKASPQGSGGARLSNKTVKTNNGQLRFGTYKPPTSGLTQEQIDAGRNPISRKVAKNNPAFDRLTDEEKKINAYRSNPNHPEHSKFIPDVIFEDNKLSPGKLIRNNNTREEKIKQYQDAYKSSPYTQPNLYRNTQNRKKELEIMSNDEAKTYLKNKFGLTDEQIKSRNLLGRVYYKHEQLDPITGEKIEKSTGKRVARQYGDLTPITRNSDVDDNSRYKTKAPNSGNDIADGSNYVRRSDGSLERRVGELDQEYKNSQQGRITRLAKKQQDFNNKVQAEKNEYAERYYKHVLENDDEFKGEYAEKSKLVQTLTQEKQEFDMMNKIMKARRNQRNHRQALPLEHFYKGQGISTAAADAFLRAQKNKNPDWSMPSSYHWAKGTLAQDPYTKLQDAKKELSELEERAKNKAISAYEEQNADRLNKEKDEFDTEFNALKDQYQKEDELGRIQLGADKDNALNEYLDKQSQYNYETDSSRGSRVGSNRVGGYEKVESIYGGYKPADEMLTKLEQKHKDELEEYDSQLEENKQNLIKRYEALAARAQTKEAGERFLAQKMALINDSEGKVRADIIDRQTKEREKIESEIRLNPELQGIQFVSQQISQKQASGKALNIKELQEMEKIEFIKSFAETDEGDPLTVITRALKAYENASKISDEEGVSTELELGSELDKKLQAWGAISEIGEDGAPQELKDIALNPIQAFEWLLSNGANSTVAKEMLELRGIEGDTIKEARESYWKNTFGMSDEEVGDLFKKEGSDSMRTKYLNGELSEEEATLYLERVANDAEAKRAKGKTTRSSRSSESTPRSSGKHPASNYSQELQSNPSVINAERENRSQYTDMRDEVVGLLRLGILSAGEVEDYLLANGQNLKAYERDSIKSFATEYDRATGERNIDVPASKDNDPEVAKEFERILSVQEQINNLDKDRVVIHNDSKDGQSVFVDGVRRKELEFSTNNKEARRIKAEFDVLTTDSERARYIARLEDKNPAVASLLAKLSTYKKVGTNNNVKPTKKSPETKDTDGSDENLDDFLSQFD